MQTLLLFLAIGFSGGPAPAAPADLIVPPMVQLGSRKTPDEAMVALVWQTTDADHPYTIRATESGRGLAVAIDYRTIKIEGIPEHRAYTADVTRYRPGGKIDYHLMSADRDLASGEFTAPKSDRQDYSFAVFGDFGKGNKEEAEVSYQTALKHPDFVVLTGDLVYGNGRASEYRTNFFPQFLNEMTSPDTGSNLFANSLIVGVPGNHDILDRNAGRYPDLQAYFYYWRETLNGPLTIGDPSSPVLTGDDARKQAIIAAAGPNYPRMANFSFDYGNSHWTCLDANRYVNWNDPKLRDWLRNDLLAAKNKTWRFIALHQPPFHSATSHQQEKQMRAVADIFEECHVDVVFCGHVHNYQRTYPIQVGPKKGASKEVLDQNDWPIDKDYDGIKDTHPKGIIYLVDGAGGAEIYQPEFEHDHSKWNPFQAVYSGDWSSSYVTIHERTFKLIQTNKDGKVIDQFTIQK